MPGNLVQVAEQLKGAPDQFLQQESQNPSGYAPPFLILGEISRRQQLRKAAQAGPPPATTVQQDLMRAAAPPPGMMPPPSVGLGALMQRTPIRMQVGGPVVEPYPQSVTADWASALGTQKTQEQIDEEERRKKRIYATPEGYVIGGVLFKNLPDAPAFEARPPEPIHIEEPAIEPLLERVRAMRDSPTSTYESRVAELEQERKKVRQPTLGDWAIQAGLGSMASRSPFAFQAFGEGALNALKDVNARREAADDTRRGIASQIASVRLAQEQERRRLEGQNFDLASAMQQRLHGQAVTEAQAEMQYRGQVEAARKAAYEQQLEQQRAQHRYGTQIATTSLEQLTKPDPYDPRKLEQEAQMADIRLAREMALAEKKHGYTLSENAALYGLRQSLVNKAENEARKSTNLNAAVGALYDHEVRKDYHDFSKTPNQILDESKQQLVKNLDDPRYFQDIPWERRGLLKDRVLAWDPPERFKNTLDENLADWATKQKEDPKKASQERMKGASPMPNLNEATGGPEGSLRYLPARPEGGAAAPAAGPTVGSDGKIRMDESYVTGYKPGQQDKKAPLAPRSSVGLAASPHLQPSASVTPAPAAVPTPGGFGPKFMTPENVTLYAQRNGITRDEAKARLRAEGWTIPEPYLSWSSTPRGSSFGRGAIEGR